MSVHGGPDLYDLTTPLSDSQRTREDALRAEREAAALRVCRAQLHGDDLTTILQALGLQPCDNTGQPAAPRVPEHDATNHNAKLTPGQIVNMRAARAHGTTCRELAREYGVTETTVSRHTKTAAAHGVRPRAGAPA